MNSKKKYLIPWVLAVHTKLSMKNWRFGTDASDELTTGTEENVGQPTSAIYISGLLGSAAARSVPVSLKKVNDHVAASWIVVLACHACTLTILVEKANQYPPRSQLLDTGINTYPKSTAPSRSLLK